MKRFSGSLLAAALLAAVSAASVQTLDCPVVYAAAQQQDAYGFYHRQLAELSANDKETKYSVFIKDLTDKGADAFVYRDTQMRSASMIKIFILATAYQLNCDGKLDLDEKITYDQKVWVPYSDGLELTGVQNGDTVTLRQLLRWMIIYSDNTATNLMIDRLGFDKINEYISSQNYDNTVLQRKMMDFEAAKQGKENYTSVMELGRTLNRLYQHKLVSDTADREMLAILREQADGNVVAQLPVGVEIAHKTGMLEGAYHDGGIIFADGHDYIAVVMTDGSPQLSQTTRNLQKFLKTVHQHVVSP